MLEDGSGGAKFIEGPGPRARARVSLSPGSNPLLVLRSRRGHSQIVSNTSYALGISRDRYNPCCHVRILYLTTQRHNASRGGDLDIVRFNALVTS